MHESLYCACSILQGNLSVYTSQVLQGCDIRTAQAAGLLVLIRAHGAVAGQTLRQCGAVAGEGPRRGSLQQGDRRSACSSDRPETVISRSIEDSIAFHFLTPRRASSKFQI
jgi:hypothetical protein